MFLFQNNKQLFLILTKHKASLQTGMFELFNKKNVFQI